MHGRKNTRVFMGQKRLAIVGVSRNPQDFTRVLFREFLKQGYDVIPVNPNATEVEGRKCFARVGDINPGVGSGPTVAHKHKHSTEVPGWKAKLIESIQKSPCPFARTSRFSYLRDALRVQLCLRGSAGLGTTGSKHYVVGEPSGSAL